MNIKDNWEEIEYGIRWIGTNKEFEEWLRLWRIMVPKCIDFICCHDSDSCCINFACDGSMVSTMRRGTSCICESVNCIDCLKKYHCKHGHQSQEQNEKESLKFIEFPVCDTCRYRNENGKRCTGIDKVLANNEYSCSAWRLWMKGDE
jgi:hypothetical protein